MSEFVFGKVRLKNSGQMERREREGNWERKGIH